MMLPAIGLYCSLRWSSFVGAWVWTLFLGVLLPLALWVVIPIVFFMIYGFRVPENCFSLSWAATQLLLVIGPQLLLAGLLTQQLCRNLVRQKFAFRTQ